MKSTTKTILIGLLLLLIPSCASDPKIVHVSDPVALYHPVLPEPPYDLSKVIVGPSVVTVDNMNKKITDKNAYIMFTYDDWLEFAKWMKTDKIYKEKLRKVIQLYSDQDQTKNVDSNSKTK